MLPSKSKAFTLIELLVVIGILTILLSIVLVAINPSRQFKQANNTQRRSDINAILNAIHQYSADNRGALPSGITNTAKTLGDGTGELDICGDLVPTYIAKMPIDPTNGTGDSLVDCSGSYTTGYTVKTEGSSSRITVASPNAELDETIAVTR